MVCQTCLGIEPTTIAGCLTDYATLAPSTKFSIAGYKMTPWWGRSRREIEEDFRRKSVRLREGLFLHGELQVEIQVSIENIFTFFNVTFGSHFAGSQRLAGY